jgi:hypothetical protein
MRRREFIKVLGGIAFTLPLTARAQQTSAPIRHIGVLMPLREDDQRAQVSIAVLRDGLQQLG